MQANLTTTAGSSAVTGDWICISCEYPLVGLDPAGACPECGTRVAISLRDDRLAHANPLWLLRLADSAILMCVASLVAIVCEIMFAAPISLQPLSLSGHFFGRILTLNETLYWLALWLLATPEYVAAGQRRHVQWCWIIRALATLALFCQWSLTPLLDLSPIAKLLASFAMPLTTILVYARLAGLARRIPDRMLSSQALIVAACVVTADLVNHALPRFDLIRPTPMLHITTNVMRLVFILASGYAVFILSRFSIRFTAAANAAMKNYLPEHSPTPTPPNDRA